MHKNVAILSCLIAFASFASLFGLFVAAFGSIGKLRSKLSSNKPEEGASASNATRPPVTAVVHASLRSKLSSNKPEEGASASNATRPPVTAVVHASLRSKLSSNKPEEGASASNATRPPVTAVVHASLRSKLSSNKPEEGASASNATRPPVTAVVHSSNKPEEGASASNATRPPVTAVVHASLRSKLSSNKPEEGASASNATRPPVTAVVHSSNKPEEGASASNAARPQVTAVVHASLRSKLSSNKPEEGASASNATHPQVTAVVHSSRAKNDKSHGFDSQTACSDIAFLLVGLVRTFAYRKVRDLMVTNMIQALAGNLRFKSFAVMGIEDDPRASNRREKQRTWMMPKCTRDGQMSFESWFAAFHMAFAGFYSKDGQFCDFYSNEDWRWQDADRNRMVFKHNSKCSLKPPRWNAGSVLKRWGSQWLKVQAVYRMMQAYERENACVFQYVVRLRPDVVHLSPAPAVLNFGLHDHQVVVPAGIVGHLPGGFNDHIAVCFRGNDTFDNSCKVYFNVWDRYAACNGTRNLGWDDGTWFLGQTMKQFGINAKEVELEYTIMPFCDSKSDKAYVFQCSRLPKASRAKCKKIQMSICMKQHR